MLKTVLVALLVFNFPVFNGLQNLFVNVDQIAPKEGNSGTLEKMIVANGSVAMNLDLSKLNGNRGNSKGSNSSRLQFDVERDAFFVVLVYNGELRGPIPSSMNINPKTSAALPSKLDASYNQLIVEHMPFGSHYELVVRDGKTGFPFFNIEGQLYNYNSGKQSMTVRDGRMLISTEFAQEMGRPDEAGKVVGEIAIEANMRPIEVTNLVDGKVESAVLPAGSGKPENAGTRPGPDVVVGDVFGLSQFGGSNGTQVGLALGTTSCNYGTQDLNWFSLPNNDHPVIPQNLYRMSADESRFEQIGQSNVKHAFTALTQNLCGLGCNGVGGSRLGSGCSDPYSAGLNAGPNLGSKAWINPFTGEYPRGDSATPPNSHSGHSHQGPSHRILTESNDLSTQMNVGSRYFAEGQYVTPHEYEWCQSNPGECNMNNNISYREYNVNGVGSPFNFSPVGSTVREAAAINAWNGATLVQIQPDAANDGVATVAYKVTQISAAVWHYEYVIYNQNLDRAVQSLSVPLGGGVVISNRGFSAPPQHPGWLNDGTAGSAGFSATPWTETETPGSMTWSSETLAQNENANAIRWGTMYSFGFDSTSPPQNTNATIGFFKTGVPITVPVQGPTGEAVATVSVSGRVMTSDGSSGVSGAQVSVTDGGLVGGATILTYTNPFGYYRVTGITPGLIYTIGVSSKQYTFMPQQVEVNDTLTGVNFQAQ